jgi:hypothetical protein
MIQVLPYEIRQQFKQNYINTKNIILSQQTNIANTIAVGRDTSRLGIQLVRECDTVLTMLDQPEPNNVEELRTILIDWLIRWDKVYKLDAREYYPEYLDFLEKYGYHV